MYRKYTHTFERKMQPLGSGAERKEKKENIKKNSIFTTN